MESRSLSFVAEATGGRLRHGSGAWQVKDVTTDSRRVAAGQLFVALSGDRFDGHDFLEQVAAAGVGAVMIRSGVALPEPWPERVGVVEVGDTRVGLGRLAARYRLDFDLSVVVVAGSNGKTSTKEFIATVLGQRGPVLKSEASFNNDIGVPLTLLRMESQHWAAVLEVGTNHPGELAPLVRMVRPEVGVITSIGREHLEFFGDVEGVLEEEGTVAELLPDDGVLILGPIAESHRLMQRASTGVRVLRCGEMGGDDWQVGGIQHGESGLQFDVTAAPQGASVGWVGSYRLELVGRHQAMNAVLGLMVGERLGLSAEEGRRGVEACRPAWRRLELARLGGFWLLDDSYNANADSMIAAIRTWSELKCPGRRWAVLGDMAELGEHAAASHCEVGQAVGEVPGAVLLALGTYAAETVRSAVRAGCQQARVTGSVEEILDHLKGGLGDGDVVLVKASRSSGLDRVSDGLKACFAAGGDSRRG